LNDSVKNGLAKYAAKQMFKIALARLPFLSFGPLGWIVQQILFRLAFKFLDATILGIHLLIIDLDVSKDVIKIRKILDKIKSMDENVTDKEKEKADKELGEAGIDIIRFK